MTARLFVQADAIERLCLASNAYKSLEAEARLAIEQLSFLMLRKMIGPQELLYWIDVGVMYGIMISYKISGIKYRRDKQIFKVSLNIPLPYFQ
jgi:hypothetical protein